MSARILQRELAEALAERWHRAEDVDRVAEASGLKLESIARYPRPIDHWSAAVAEAIDKRVVARVIDNAQLGADEKSRFASLDEAPSGAPMPPSLRFTLEWSDVDEDERETPWRVETGGTRRALKAEVRVYGGAAELRPTLRWRRRRVLAFTKWQNAVLKPLVENPTAGFAAYEAGTQLTVGSVRTWRLDAEARVDDQRRRLNRFLIPAVGTYCAGLIALLLAAFVIWWLWYVPEMKVSLGFGTGALALAIGFIQSLVPRDGVRGPYWGLTIAERAMVSSVIAGLALVVLPRYLLVIVENQTANEVPFFDHQKHQQALAPGRHTVAAWDAPGSDPTDEICACRAGSRSDVGCSCKAAGSKERGIPLLYFQCRRKAWDTGMAKPPAAIGKDVELVAQRIWLKPDAKCIPLPESTVTYDLADVSRGALGTVAVHHPWNKSLQPVRIAGNAVTSEMSIRGDGSEGSLLEIHATTSVPLSIPALDPKKRLALDLSFRGDDPDRSGALNCTAEASDSVDVLSFEIPSDAKVELTGTITSTWSTSSRLPRYCGRKDTVVNEVRFTLDKPVKGAVFDVPFDAKRMSFAIGQAKAISSTGPCPNGRASLVEVDKNITGALDLTLLPSATDAPSPGMTRTWRVTPVDVADERLALVCDPPQHEILATAGTPQSRYRLSAAEVEEALAVVPIRDVCIIRQDPTHPVPALRCPANCSVLPEHDSTTIDVRNRFPNCKKVCQC
ncbi:MAG TPA: hypothetical protein VM261_09010 [Kofleriaceae bacterium]|nr:hypothetical protein [Kofleriaceae bacterium]